MSTISRIQKLEQQIKPKVETLVSAIGGSDEHFAVVDAKSRSGFVRLPDGRWLTAQEWDGLCAEYAGRGGPPVIVLDR
jgi:hypothetical protein